MSDIKKLFKSSVVYFIGNVLSKIMVFFLVPLYTKHIPATSFGYFDAATAIVQFVQGFLFLDIGATILRFMLDQEVLKESAINVGLTIFAGSMFLYAVSGIFVGIFANIEYVWYLLIYGAIGIANIVSSSIARGNNYSKYYAFTGVVSTFINVILNIILILVAKMDYKALYIALIASQAVQFMMLELKNKNFTTLHKLYYNKVLLKTMFRYALPLSVNIVAYWGLTSLNKVIISSMLGTAANGYLAIANKFTSMVYLLSTCFQLAWQELAFSKKNELSEKTGDYYSHAFKLLLKISMTGLLLILPAIAILLAIFPSFIDQQYNAAVALIPIAMAGAIMSIASSFLGSIFGGIKKTNIIFVSTLCGALINVGVIFALIKLGVGVQSSNIAFLIGFAVTVLIRTFLLYKYIKMKTNYLYFIIFTPFFIAVSYAFIKLPWYANLISIIFVVILSIFVFKKEIALIRSKLKKKSLKKGKSARESLLTDMHLKQEEENEGLINRASIELKEEASVNSVNFSEDKMSSEMDIKKLQNKLLEILKAFHEFCEINNLKYYITSGTLLGAIRHKGFIPWDDDIDVAMPDDDYRKLISIASKMEIYEIKERSIDSMFRTYGFMKMYDPRTTYIESMREHKEVRGVYIDIFPLNGFGNSYKKAVKSVSKIMFLKKLAYVNIGGHNRGNFIKSVYSYFIGKINIERIFNKMEKIAYKNKFISSEYVGNAYGVYGAKELFNISTIGEPTLYEFEGFKFYGVEDYDAYLTSVYGDYMKLPKEEDRKKHSIYFCDFDLPYKDYIKNKESMD